MQQRLHEKFCLFYLFLFHPAAEKCEEFTDLNLSHSIIGTSLRVRLLLYTRSNATCGVLLSHTNLSNRAQFNLSRPTTFIIHGFRPTGSPPVWLQELTELLLFKEDMNIVVVDWNHGAANVNYLKVVENTRKAADNLTVFVKMMQVRWCRFSHSRYQCHGQRFGNHLTADLFRTKGPP